MIACQRMCCLCHLRKHTRMVCHHIAPDASGGADTLDNCIPLCPDCYGEVMTFHPDHHPGVTQYYPEELRRRRDEWYAQTRRRTEDLATNLHRSTHAYPYSTAVRGRVTFDYSEYNGFYRLGEGNYELLTRWTKHSDTAIYCYRDDTNISIALARGAVEVQDIRDASLLHFGSRAQTIQTEKFVVLENHCARYAAIKIRKIQDETRNDASDLLVFDYWILDDGSDDFSVV